MFTIKHASVVFADIAGSSAIMQRDEIEGLASLEKFRRTITANVCDFNGQLLHIWGDGCLATFNSAKQAIQFAINVQNQFMQPACSIDVRMGINCGEVHMTDNNAYGHAVNQASYLESISKPGAVLITDCVRKELSNKNQKLLISMGNLRTKVDEHFKIFAVNSHGLVVPGRKDFKYLACAKNDKSTSFREGIKSFIKLFEPIIKNGVL